MEEIKTPKIFYGEVSLSIAFFTALVFAQFLPNQKITSQALIGAYVAAGIILFIVQILFIAI